MERDSWLLGDRDGKTTKESGLLSFAVIVRLIFL